MSLRHLLAPLLLLLAAGCASDSPTGPSVDAAPTPTPSAPATPPPVLHDVSLVVFYDEDGNGALDPSEGVRLPGVTVESGAQSAVTGGGGSAVLKVAEGSQTVKLRQSSLPSYYQAGQGVSLQVPQTTQIVVPATLPITGVRHNVYMAFGDSITLGEGSSDGNGYRQHLQYLLRGHFGHATVENEGISGTRSNRGAERLPDSLAARTPAFTLIMYGTNDWNDRGCQLEPPCFTIDSLHEMVRTTRAAGSLPILATIPLPNTGYDERVPPQREDWVESQNERLALMAAEEKVVLVNMEEALPNNVDRSNLYFDHLHPNDRGYERMADAWFAALTRPQGATAADTMTLAEAIASVVAAPLAPSDSLGPDLLPLRGRRR
ncbi:MAG: SGNH/GDSL hydrolase family protein [Vicinamibacteria bacterium]